MATILEKLKAVHQAVKADESGELGAKLSKLAVDAIMEGFEKPGGDEAPEGDETRAWVKYMSVFADNAAQLQLLTKATPGEPGYLRETRAYIVSNAVCAPATEAFTAMGVNPQIANDAPDNVDGTVESPLAGLIPA